MTRKEIFSERLLERTSMFNDAVYAIALTLLVLEIKLPEREIGNSPHEMIEALKLLSPKLLAFLLSVISVGGRWLSSVNLQRTLKGADIGYVIYSV